MAYRDVVLEHIPRPFRGSLESPGICKLHASRRSGTAIRDRDARCNAPDIETACFFAGSQRAYLVPMASAFVCRHSASAATGGPRVRPSSALSKLTPTRIPADGVASIADDATTRFRGRCRAIIASRDLKPKPRPISAHSIGAGSRRSGAVKNSAGIFAVRPIAAISSPAQRGIRWLLYQALSASRARSRAKNAPQNKNGTQKRREKRKTVNRLKN
jgi:hypothetical protein